MAVVLSSNTMAQNNTTNVNDDLKPKIFHDFLGRQVTSGDASSASASPAAGGPISTTSDLGSDRQVGSHLEGVPFYGQRNDYSGIKIGNRYAGSKRSNSVFMGLSRDGVPQTRSDFPEISHSMKILRNAGQEQPKRSHEDEAFVHPMRPTSRSLIIQSATGPKADANASKWDRAIPVNVGPVLQYPQAVPYAYQTLSNRFKEANVSASVISQTAADEGSRTGIKGSGILSSVNVSSGVAESSISKQKCAISVPEPGSSTPLRRQGSTSVSRQMTIFYGGQAHVFDDVHPNKADAIMALAGSSGGSWSTSFSPSSATKLPSVESNPAAGENTGRLYVAGNSGSSPQLSLLPRGGGHEKVVIKNARQPMEMEAGAEANLLTDDKL